MTPLPKRRHSTQRGGKRESAIHKFLAHTGKCPKCGAEKLPHRICPNCGYYGEKNIIPPKIKPTKEK